MAGDEVRVVGGEAAGRIVPSRLLGNGSLELVVSEEVVRADRFAWVFAVDFGGGDRSGSGVGLGNGTGNGTAVGRPGSPVVTPSSSGVGRLGTCLGGAMVMLAAGMLAFLV